MTWLSTERLKLLRRLSLAARRKGAAAWMEPPGRRPPAGGTEPTGWRDYAPGDDPRRIDWKLCSRRDELLTKLFEGWPDRRVYVLVDGSRSMGMGRPAKLDLARSIAAAVSWLALIDGACVQLATIADRLAALSPTLAGRAAFGRAARFLADIEPQGSDTDLRAGVAALLRARRRPGPTLLLSDLCDDAGWQAAVNMLRHRGFAPRVVQLIDPRDAEPPGLGDFELADAERGTVVRATITERVAARYREKHAAHERRIVEFCRRRAVALVRVECSEDEAEAVTRSLRAKTPRDCGPREAIGSS